MRARLWIGWVLMIGCLAPVVAQDKAHAPPEDLAQWSLHCFCITAVRSPHSAIGMDGNGRLLHRARQGVTRDVLEHEGISVSDSQVELLRLLGVLDVEGDMLTTAFPVIGPDQLDVVRPRLRRLAERVLPDIEADVAAIRSRLREMGLSHSEYALVFGHAVDGLLWDQLREHDALPSTELSLAHPFWRGAFWALYPVRAQVAGVNEHHAGDATLVLTWTPATTRALRGLDKAAGLPDALRRLAAGRAPAPVVDDAGRVWALAEDGRAQVPVVYAHADDPLHAPALAIATTLADTLRGEGEMASILASIEGADRKQAMVVVAHEFIWDVMDVLVESGRVDRPPVLDDADADADADPDALRALLVVRVDGKGVEQDAL